MTTVAEGEVANAFDYAAIEGTKLSNYEITVVTGKIAVVKGTISGGGDEPGAGGIPEGGLSKFDAVRIYNGQRQTIDTNALVAAFAQVMVGAFTVEYAENAADGGAPALPWTTVPPTIKDVGESVLWYRVTSPNYETFVHAAKVTIMPKTLTDKMCVADEDAAWFFDGTEKKPAVTVVDGDPNIATTNDFILTYSGKTGAGKFPVTVTGTNNYCGTVEEEFEIRKADAWGSGDEPGAGEIPLGGKSKFDVTCEYDGKMHTINTNALLAIVKKGFSLAFSYALTKEGAYQAEPFAYTDVVTTSFWYKISLNNANYEDYVHEAKVTITVRDIANATIAPIDDQTATGAAIRPVPIVTDGEPSIVKASDYDVSYANNVNPGTATLTLTGKGNYAGTKSATFKVVSGDETWAVFDAMGGLVNGEGVVSQKVSSVYGTLPVAIREGYVLSGWYLGVTNNAPKATDNGAVLATGTHTLFAKWTYDSAITPNPATIYKWEAIDGNTVRIIGFKNSTQKLKTMALPDKIGGRFVTEIGSSAFANSTCGVTKLLLPMFCTKIGDKAFLNIPSITGITFAEIRDWTNPSMTALLDIGKCAFSGAKGLTTLSLGDAVGSLGNYAFLNTRKLASVTILGKPNVGTQVFRSAGLDTTGVTIHIDPALASDTAYMAALKANMYNVTVRTDAIVKGIQLTTMSVSPKIVKLTMSVDAIKTWSGVDTSALKVQYRASLGDDPVSIFPTTTTRNADGTVTLEVVSPQGSSGFFQAILEK